MFSVLRHRPLITDLPARSPGTLPDALRRFCHSPASYRKCFAQSQFATAFDGYSYPGQQDSLNQGPEDQLHSFVLSDFSTPTRYPDELQPFLHQHWQELTRWTRAVEQHVLKELSLTHIALQHQSLCSHMLSANYYPAPATPQSADRETGSAADLRLSPHPDVSLLTVMFSGLGEGFQYQDSNGCWVDAPPTDRVVVFAGDLLQWLTDGAIPALNHRVKQTGNEGERFSFALFSLPRPGASLLSNAGHQITTEDWYRLHLSQWDE